MVVDRITQPYPDGPRKLHKIMQRDQCSLLLESVQRSRRHEAETAGLALDKTGDAGTACGEDNAPVGGEHDPAEFSETPGERTFRHATRACKIGKHARPGEVPTR